MPDRVIEVPNSAAIRQARSFLGEADWSVAPGRTVIRFHPAYCHMQPWVLSALAAWALVARALVLRSSSKTQTEPLTPGASDCRNTWTWIPALRSPSMRNRDGSFLC